MIARSIAILFGALILAAVAHVTVISSGGYFSPQSYVTIAVAIGVGCASVFSGMAWSHNRRAVGVGLVLAIIAGEAFGLIATAERLIASRDAAQTPLLEQQEARQEAERQVRIAEAAVNQAPTTSDRLVKAEAAKAEAEAAVTEKSAERGCRENCAKLLQAKIDAAAAEVASARAELRQSREAAEAELELARAALNGIKKPPSATPLADRIGVPAWGIDLVHSALGSIAANGLACFLLIFGAHHHAPARVEVVTALSIAPPPSPRRQPTPGEHAAQFGVECLAPGGLGTDLEAIRRAYGAWCGARGFVPLPGREIGRLLLELFEDAGITIAERNGRLIAVGVSIIGVETGTALVPVRDIAA